MLVPRGLVSFARPGGNATGINSFTSEVLAKHDETYMPKEVADALKAQGLWKEDSEKQVGAAPPGRTP